MTVLDRIHSKPAFRVPKGACDCHMHVFGPRERYPFSPERTYTPPDAPLDIYRKMAATIGLERLVLVQASPYGADNRRMLDAMRAVGPTARMVAGIDEATPAAALPEMDKLGVRGVRLNMASRGERDPAKIARLVRRTAERIGPLGWHLQLFTDVLVIEQLAPVLNALPVPLVIDHMGLAKGELGLDQPGLPELRHLVASGRAWVKLSGAYRVSQREPDFPDSTPIARALIADNPDRVTWGSDWPHTGKHGHSIEAEPPPISYRPLDDGRLLDLLAEQAGSEAMIERILVTNPAKLYGFP